MPKMPPSCSAESCAASAGLVATWTVAAALLLSGCGAACDTGDEGNHPERYTGGTATGGVYESSSWNSGLLPFSGGKQYQLEHHLGFTPAIIGVYIGFGADAEPVALCAGNSCLIHCVDDQMIWIKNDTCADFWVRVAAQGKSFENRDNACTGGSADAGSVVEAGAPDSEQELAVDGAVSDQGSLPDESGSD